MNINFFLTNGADRPATLCDVMMQCRKHGISVKMNEYGAFKQNKEKYAVLVWDYEKGVLVDRQTALTKNLLLKLFNKFI